jgi:stress response protein SCP2
MAITTRDGAYRREGSPRAKKFIVGGSVTVAPGDVVQIKEASGSIILGVSGAEVLGVALEASASGSTAEILVDLAYPGDIFEMKIETGTMAAVQIGDEADINSADGLTLTESNNDVLLVGWNGTNTDLAYVTFKNTFFGA